MRRIADKEVGSLTETKSFQHPISLPVVKAGRTERPTEQFISEAPDVVDDIQIPQHESAEGSLAADAIDKLDRTVFLGNVSVEAIKSKSARKVLLAHLSSCLSNLRSTEAVHKVESLRFRSTAFASGVGPKRAAFAKKEVMEETSHSTHAYVVYTTKVAAKRAATSLNGTMVLDRHLRTDLVAHPAEVDHRRCVFVGNLGFVDEEMVETPDKSGGIERKRRGKQPADAEEGLWRTFSKVGRIESVRMVRDRSTRVGKGIAYVQFHDENGVEAALLYNEKRFPPLLPRTLRVTRARKPKTSMARPSSQQGAAKSKLSGRTTNARNSTRLASTTGQRIGRSDKGKTFVFEGHRATKPNGPTGKSITKKRKYADKPTTRSSRRGAAFKEAGGTRERV